MNALTVSEVVRRTGLSRETLRYYEREGLLEPRRSASNGYRVFDDNDLERLEFISRTKRAGFKIRQIRELLELKQRITPTCELGLEMALEQIRRVDEQIESLREVRAILTDFAKQCEKEGPDAPCSLSFNRTPVLFEDRFFGRC